MDDNQNSYKINSDKNNVFIVNLTLKDKNILITIGKINTFPKILFSSTFTLDDIKKNPMFYSTESIEDALKMIKENIEKLNPSIIEENNKLILNIQLNYPKDKNLILEVNKIEKDEKESIDELYSLINLLYEKINEQNKTNNSLKKIIINQKVELLNEFNSKISEKKEIILSQNNKITSLENIIIDQNLKISEQKKEIEQLSNFIKTNPNFQISESENNKNYLFQISKIIKFDKEKEQQIRDWITPSNTIYIKLIFQLTRDGKNCVDFHRLCDNRGPTLVLIETDRGYKFGGFTSSNWDKSNLDKIDDWTFIFSLNKMEKFTRKINCNKRSIFCCPYLGPCFGASDFGINQNMNTGWSSVNGTFINNRECTNGECYFNVVEMEVYQVMVRHEY